MNNIKPFNVLCLDGGGLRGIYQATYLKTFSEKVSNYHDGQPVDIGQAFDLIAGTSTGGIVGTAVAAGIGLDKVQLLYEEKGGEIFPFQCARRLPFIGLIILLFGFGLRKGDEALRRELKSVLGDLTFEDIYKKNGIALLLTTIDLARDASVIFKTNHLKRLNGRDDKRLLVDACMATTAAPTFRSLAALVEPVTQAKVTYADGGLWANNPAVIAAVEASEILKDRGEDDRPINLFMLGALPAQGGEEVGSGAVHRGAVGWKYGKRVVEVSLNSQSVAYDYMASKILSLRGDGNLAFRMLAQCPSAQLLKRLQNLDDARPNTLNALKRQAVSDVDYAWAKSFDENNPMHKFRLAISRSTTNKES